VLVAFHGKQLLETQTCVSLLWLHWDTESVLQHMCCMLRRSTPFQCHCVKHSYGVAAVFDYLIT
jgi:hypothetical protein